MKYIYKHNMYCYDEYNIIASNTVLLNPRYSTFLCSWLAVELLATQEPPSV